MKHKGWLETRQPTMLVQAMHDNSIQEPQSGGAYLFSTHKDKGISTIPLSGVSKLNVNDIDGRLV
eukprot:scaffold340886_cov79-Cyclotella_meneghiniana.AAC.2